MSTQSKRKNQPESIDNHEGHLPDYETMRKRCAYCALGVGGGVGGGVKKIEHSPSVCLLTFHYA